MRQAVGGVKRQKNFERHTILPLAAIARMTGAGVIVSAVEDPKIV